MLTKRVPLSELVEWFEQLLDARTEHVGECLTLFASDARSVEFHIDADESRVAGVTNYSLPHEEWLGDRDVVKIAVMGWKLDLIDEASEPRYIRRFGPDESTQEIISNVMRVFTSIYLAPFATDVVVAQRVARP